LKHLQKNKLTIQFIGILCNFIGSLQCNSLHSLSSLYPFWRISMSISHRLNKHFALAAVATAAVAATSNAAVVYSGVINFVCAVDFDGCYINVQTNALSNGPGSGVPGWDVNPYSTGNGMNFYNSTGGGQLRYPGVTAGPAGNLALGTSIGSTGSFNISTTGVVFGASAGNWQYSAENVIGFRFVAAAGTTHYGWMRFLMGAAGSSGTSRTVVDYGYESTAATSILAGAGAVPAPGAIALLGLAGLAARRRRA
jgi:hypothetical protein